MNLTTFCDHRIAVSRIASKTTGVLTIVLLLCGCLFAPSAIASIYTLNPGGNNSAFTTTFPVGGTLVGSNYFAFNSGTLDGEITSLVYQGDLANPYHGLTFTYSVDLFGASVDSLSQVTVGSYGGFSTDLSYNSNSVSVGGGIAPSNFTRSAGTGDTLHFVFNSPGNVLPGQDSALVVVQSSALNFKTAMGGVIDSLPANVSVLAPIPEPAIGSLLVTGLGAFFFWRRK